MPFAILWGIGEALWNIVVNEIPSAIVHWWDERPWGDRARKNREYVKQAVKNAMKIEWE